MKYSLTITIYANIAVSADSSQSAMWAIEKVLEDAIDMKIGIAEFVIEHGEVTGVYDAEGNEIEVEGDL